MIRFADAGESGDKKEKDVFCGLCLQKTSFLYGYKVIKEKITNNMPTREKIKVIHDYIIDNAEYDKLKYENKKRGHP